MRAASIDGRPISRFACSPAFPVAPQAFLALVRAIIDAQASNPPPMPSSAVPVGHEGTPPRKLCC